MSTRRPPIAPKSAALGVEGQQIVLESHTPSPRKSSVSEYGNLLGSTRPRSPRPADVYSAAMAELTEGEGRGLTKIRTSGPSPSSSPGRRRAITMASVNSLNPLSPGRSATATSILDHGGYKTMTFSGVSGTTSVIGSASARVLSALDEHRSVVSPPDGSMSATAPLPSTPPRKATSAPDSQSAQAQMRSAINPWRSGLHDTLGPLGGQGLVTQSPRTAAVAAAAAAGHRGGAPASPPLHGLQFVPVPPPPPQAWAAPAPQPPTVVPAAVPPLSGLPPSGSQSHLAAVEGGGGGGVFGNGRQRRNSASSTDSPGAGARGASDSPSAGTYDSPPAVNGFGLRVATLSRIGSPSSPSTPASCSLPHTPTCSSLKPRPPEAPISGRSSRKFSHLASPEARQPQGPQGPQQQPQQQPMSGSPVTYRLPMSATTTPGAATPDDPPSNPLFRRSLSMGNGSALQGGAGGGSLPGTPSASRPGSGRAGSARVTTRPVAALVDAVRSKDEAKLMEVLEALKGPHGVTSGLNERHHMTGRTPLHEAVMTNSAAMVAMLLAAGADPNIGHLTQGPPLLHCAAFGEVDTMRLLLKEGADVHATDLERSTALHFACVGGHVDAARLLLDWGGDMRARNEDNLSPLDLAPPEFPRLLLLRAQQVATGGGGGSSGGAAGGGDGSSTLPSPPLLGRAYYRRDGVGPAATAAAAGGDGGLVGIALSPERPPSVTSSRPTSGSILPVSRTGAQAVSAAAAEALAARRSVHSAGGGGGRAASTSAAGAGADGPLCSPTSQIDLSMPLSAMGPAGLRPNPPGEMGGGGAAAVTAAASGVRSRRNSTTALGTAGGGGGGGGGTAAADEPAVRGTSGVEAGAGGAAAASASAGVTPASNGGGAEAVPTSPPKLQLPGGVRRQLSRGADLGDIMSGFQKDDAEIVRRSLSSTSSQDLLAQGLAGHAHQQNQPQPQPQSSAAGWHFQAPRGMPAGPGKSKQPSPAGTTSTSNVSHAAAGPAPMFGRPTGQPASILAGAQPHPHHSQPHQSSASSQGSKKDKDKDRDKDLPQHQQALLPFALAETSVIRFGTRVQVHAAADTSGDASSPTNSHPSDGASAAVSRLPSGAVAMPSFSAGVPSISPTALPTASSPPPVGPVTPDQAAPQPPAAAATATTNTAAAAGGAGFGAVGFKPVPATGFMPPGMAAPAPAASAAAAAASRMSGSGDDFPAATPPLVRDDSPVRNRPSGDGSGDAGGGRGGAAGGGGGSGGSGDGDGDGGVRCSRHAVTRTSMLAAKALKRMSNMNASTDAIEIRAAALFRQSTDLTTGEMQWTRGELLGEGAYGKVYAGLNQQTGELMAVKVLQLVSKHGNKEAVMEQLEALQHEMSLYKKLQNKHVVGYIDAKYDPKTSAFYIFLEYVPGGSIASMLNRFGRFSEDLVRNYTRQLLMGLEYLHGSKIVHRDLKGGNVLVSRDGTVKLADFGASKAYRDHTITDCMKSVRGSVFWMAPEVIRGTGYGRKADIWSLGCTVIEMLTGTHPWQHLDNQWTAMFTIAKTEEGPPRPPNASPEALRFLDRCLQFDQAKRPTATELLQDPFVARLGNNSAANGEDRLQHSF